MGFKVNKQVADILDTHSYRVRVIGCDEGVVISTPPNNFIAKDTRQKCEAYKLCKGDEPGLMCIGEGGEGRFVPMAEFAFPVVLNCILMRSRLDIGFPHNFTVYERQDGTSAKSIDELIQGEGPVDLQSQLNLYQLIDSAMAGEFDPSFDEQARKLDMFREFQACKNFFLGKTNASE